MIEAERLGIILKPEEQTQAKYNAGMVLEGDTVHMLYRYAEHGMYVNPDPKHISTGIVYKVNEIRYAKLDKYCNLIKDYDEPVIQSSNGTGINCGAEDPRIVLFEGQYYIFYCNFADNEARVGIAVTKDFKEYKKLGIIPTKDWDKDAFIFPERVDGKIAYMHRIEPNIQIDYFDSFEDMLSPDSWKAYDAEKSTVLKSVEPWEGKKMGGSIPPIKTELGWLILYHAVAHDREPSCYRMGACIAEYENPSNIIAKLPYPVFEPEKEYEIIGDIHNVVFPQGGYVLDDKLYISYGAADKYTAVAKLDYVKLIDELKKLI